MDYKQGDMIEVEWFDAADEAEGWQDIAEALKNPPCHPVKTIGYFLEEKEKHLYLTPTMKGDEMAVLSIIPLGCIITTQLLIKAIKYEGPHSVNTKRPDSIFVYTE